MVGGAAQVIVSTSQLLAAASTAVRVTNTSTQRVPVTLPATQAIVVGEVEVKNDAGNPVPVSGTMSLSTGTLAALETISAAQSGVWTVGLSTASLAALETIQAAQSGAWTVSLSTGSLAALEAVTVQNTTSQRVPVQATVVGTVPVSGTVTANLGTIDGANAEVTQLKVMRGLTDYETRLDYSTRLDGNPVYVGKHANGTSTTSTTWTVQKLTYDSLSRLTRAQVLSGSWSGRAALGW